MIFILIINQEIEREKNGKGSGKKGNRSVEGSVNEKIKREKIKENGNGKEEEKEKEKEKERKVKEEEREKEREQFLVQTGIEYVDPLKITVPLKSSSSSAHFLSQPSYSSSKTDLCIALLNRYIVQPLFGPDSAKVLSLCLVLAQY